MIINGICHTNIDEYTRQEWPKKFVSVPEIGSKVKSKSGKTLIVCEITHCYKEQNSLDPYVYSGEIFGPYIEVELTKRTFA